MTRAEQVSEIKKLVQEKQAEYTKASDAVWSTPELFFHEDKSAVVLIDLLKKEGFQVEEGVDEIPTAFIGTWGSGKPVIGFLGEFDALPNLSQEAGNPVHTPIVTGAPGHGCGHNLLGVGALAAAVAYRDYLKAHNLPGTVRYYGCPAEEAGWGKMFLARDGYFDDCDLAISWHPANHIGIRGDTGLAVICGMFDFHGRTAHAAGAPHLGRSALDAAELMNVGVNYLREHVIPEARIHYAYQNVGGEAPNVVQSYAQVKYFIRAPKVTQAKEIAERIKNIALGAAQMTGTTAEINFLAGICDYRGNEAATQIANEAMIAVGPVAFDEADYALAKKIQEGLTPQDKAAGLSQLGALFENAEERFADAVLIPDVPTYRPGLKTLGGSTDLGDVSYCCPTIYFNAPCYAAGTPGHSWQLCAQSGSSIGHKGMLHAAEMMALTGILAQESPEKLAEAKAEYDKNIGQYICPVGKDAKPQF